MKKRSINFFNMIEVALAIGVLSIGMTVLFSMFPVGFNESRKAITENYSANAAENIFAYISQRATKESNWEKAESPIELISDKKPGEILNNASLNTSTWGKIPIAEGEGKIVKDLYHIPDTANQYTNNQDEDGNFSCIYGTKIITNDRKDIAGEIRIWKNDIEKVYFDGIETTIGGNAAIGLNIEVSYPVEKPYKNREFYNYYFELFNQDPDFNQPAIPVPPGPGFEEDEGEVTITSPRILKLEVLGTSFADNNSARTPVAVTVDLFYKTSTDTEYTKVELYTVQGTYLASPYTMNVESEISFFLEATFDKQYDSSGPITRSSKTYHCVALTTGEIPPSYSPFKKQVSLEEYLEPYMDESTGQIILNENEVLYVFELGQTNTSYSGFDMQDLVMRAVILHPDQILLDDAKVARDNAQTAYNHAVAAKTAAENSYDQAVSNYNSKVNIYNNKKITYEQKLAKYNQRNTTRRLKRKNKAETAMNNAETVMDNAETAMNNAQTEIDTKTSEIAAALSALNNAQTAYDQLLAENS
ncbi:MAG TPA: hypothetical protein QF753_01680 [Victivallales bacterium]|nr:hypothetical protein [Victivallales bacterium]